VDEFSLKVIRQMSGITFLSLVPEASAILMDLIRLNLYYLFIAHKDRVLLTSVDVLRVINKKIEGRFTDQEV
ncbi:EscV/YscV/HrcV family type III secretion system export apparatus protein, partial [Salmonella enterica]